MLFYEGIVHIVVAYSIEDFSKWRDYEFEL